MWQNDAVIVGQFDYFVHCFSGNVSVDSQHAVEESRLHVFHSTENFTDGWAASGAVVADYEHNRTERLAAWCAGHPNYQPEHQHQFYHSSSTA